MVKTNDEWVIDLHDVKKVFKGRVHALRGVEMRVRGGEIFGLLGPNGAGKSTLVKIMMTVVCPTHADGTVLGRPVGHKPTLARVGYLPENHRFPRYLTGKQVLEFYGMMAGATRRHIKQRSAELLDFVGMTAWANKRIGSYSKGMMQRVGLAQAMIHDPDLILLDEPTDGVDPVGRRDIRDALIRLREKGKTVFLNSHLLSELELVCNRVAIIVKGQVVSQGTIDELTTDQRSFDIEVEPGGAGEFAPLKSLVPQSVADQIEVSEINANTIRLRTDDAAVIQPVIDALRQRKYVIRAVRPFRPSLEDLFMAAVTDQATGKVMLPGADS